VVLVAEDAVDVRILLAELLVREGFTVMQAADGREAIEKATAGRPDAIVMDLSLPIVDGLEASRRLKADPRTRHIPIIALTGRATDGSEIAIGQLSGLLTKPCVPEVLFDRLRGVLARAAAQND
jgi:CheY-like chemotaxis protein